MKIIKWILIIIAILILSVIGFLSYLGAFSPVKVYETKTGPYVIAYKSFIGPYSKTAAVFTEVYNELKAEGITSSKGLGVFYDDPKITPEDKLRSDCGAIIESKDIYKLNKIKTKLEIKEIHRSDSVVVEFPLRSVLSYMIGPMKAYPALTNYAINKNYQIAMTYEIYDNTYYNYFIASLNKSNDK